MASQDTDTEKEIRRRVIKKFYTTVLAVFAAFMILGTSSYATDVENSIPVKLCKSTPSLQEYSNCKTGADFFNTIIAGIISGLSGAILLGLPFGFITSRAKKWKLYGYEDIFNKKIEYITWFTLLAPYGWLDSVMIILRIGFYGIFFGMIAYNNAMKKRYAADLDAGNAPNITVEPYRPKKTILVDNNNYNQNDNTDTKTEDIEDEF